MILSIIIPAFKVEKFIKHCLVSCISQRNVSHSDYEIIVVNDGSSDRSGLIATETLNNIPNTKVIHQGNQGLSGARNTGIEAAKGEYLWFVDSDDWISEDALEKIFKSIEENNEPDVIMVRAQSEDPAGISTLRHNDWSKKTNLETGCNVFLSKDWIICAQFFIVKKTLLDNNNIRFMKGVFHEDNEYTPRMLYFAKSVVRINDILYHSFVNSESITHTANPKRAFDLLLVCESLADFIQKNISSQPQLNAYNDFVSLSLNNALSIISQQDYTTISEFNKEMRKHRRLFRNLRMAKNPKYKLEGWIFPFVIQYTWWYKFLLKFKP